MSSFLTEVMRVVQYIHNWILDCSSMIRTNPFLLFTVGFVAVGYAIVILGRLLSRE